MYRIRQDNFEALFSSLSRTIVFSKVEVNAIISTGEALRDLHNVFSYSLTCTKLARKIPIRLHL